MAMMSNKLDEELAEQLAELDTAINRINESPEHPDDDETWQLQDWINEALGYLDKIADVGAPNHLQSSHDHAKHMNFYIKKAIQALEQSKGAKH